MSRLLAIAAAVTLGVTLVGCGNGPRPRVEPDVAGAPAWGGCGGRSVGIIDYAGAARGEPTARAALAPYRTDGDHVVAVPPRAHHNRRWLLVDDANVIHALLELDHDRDGWLVGLVERCSDS
jgi:hypothetical protein